MKKIGGLIIAFAFLILIASVSAEINQTKIDNAYNCLESKVQGKCSSLPVSEIALILLSNPSSDITNECKEALISKKSDEGCWPKDKCKIKETAMSVIALSYLEEDTSKSEEWLLNQSQISKDLIWYLEQDSNEATSCIISYNGQDYTINVGENKKIDQDAGNCLSLTQSDYWLKVAPSCYENEFMISCDKSFISTLLYKNDESSSSPLFVLSDTQSAPALGSITLKIKTKCFGASSGCNYEESAWATLALQITGHDFEDFIPYLLATASLNKKYLPNAFIYLITDYEDYGNKLIQEQISGKFWEAESSVYGRYYDTALALIALSDSSAEQVEKSENWLFFSQANNGCWKDSIRDTSIILWAIGGGRKIGITPTLSGGTTVTDCEDSSYYCISRSECPDEDELENYFCYGYSIDKVCCKSSNLKTCSKLGGQFCSSGEYCTGNSERSSDGDDCCLGDCKEETSGSIPTAAGCDDMGYSCKEECSKNQEEIDYTCSGGDICCKTIPSQDKGISWWVWLLIISIILIIMIILYIKRDKLKLMWFKRKIGFKSEDHYSKRPFSPFPPKPGFPHITRVPARPVPKKSRSRDKGMDDTFKKLKEMTK